MSKLQENYIAILEEELRKAQEIIDQLRGATVTKSEWQKMEQQLAVAQAKIQIQRDALAVCAEYVVGGQDAARRALKITEDDKSALRALVEDVLDEVNNDFAYTSSMWASVQDGTWTPRALK